MDENEASINPLSVGFMYGYGAFETIKVHECRIIFFEEHYQRLKKSLERMRLDFDLSFQELKQVCTTIIGGNDIKNGFVKVMCSRAKTDKTDVIIYTGSKNYENKYREGLRLCLADGRRNEFSKLNSIKSLNFAENMMQKEKAVEKGFDEAVFLNTQGHTSEGCITNIFWVKGRRFFTPSIECGILSGIVRQKVIQLCEEEGLQISIGEYNFDDLESAEEIFLTNSLMEIMPVSSFVDRQFVIGELSMVNDLMQRYKLKYYSCL